MAKRLLQFLSTLTLALLFLGALPALGQSSSGLAGVVKDSSGAAVPGTVVTATSPAEQAPRTTVTDQQGVYKIIDLLPGEYTVTFSKTGFQTVKRSNITLGASFTATVNASLPVGAASTEVTVTAAAPLVDVSDAQSQIVIDRQLLNLIPSGKDPFAVGQDMPGVTTSTPDVGGTQTMQQPTLQVHGSTGSDNVFIVNGMWIQHAGYGGNQTGFYYNDQDMQEIGYQVSTLPAEAPIGGIQISMITKAGGNQFHGDLFASGANHSMQADNSTPALAAAGLVARNRIDDVYDINPSFGGPLLKNKLWFFGSYRRWGANNYVANTYTSPGGPQALDDSHLNDYTFDMSWQIDKNNKLFGMYDGDKKFRGHRTNNYIGVDFSASDADVLQHTVDNYMAQVKWTGILSNNLVAEAGYTRMPVDYNLLFEPTADPNAVAIWDTVLSTMTGVSPRQDLDSALMQTVVADISYVKGAHNAKFGWDFRNGDEQEAFQSRHDLIMEYASGLPSEVRLLSTPQTHQEDLNDDQGFYAEDSWQITRNFTLTPGIRFDHTSMGWPAQGGGGGEWFAPFSEPADKNVVNWNTWSPRLGFAWDVFGDSKTAVKGGLSKYDVLEGTSLFQSSNPNGSLSYYTCPWTSTTIPTPQSLDPATAPGCVLSVSRTRETDPNLKRPYQWEYTVLIQRQIGRSSAVSLGYYGRTYRDMNGTENTLVTSSDYAPETIANPYGGSVTVYNQNASTTKLNAIDLLTIPGLYEKYNGVELQFNTRIRGISLFSGFTVGRSYGNSVGSDANNPNNYIFSAGEIGYNAPYQVRAGGSYTLPRTHGVELGFSLRESSGLPQSIRYVVTKSVMAANGLAPLNQGNTSIHITPSGQTRYPWQNLLDLRFSKVFQLSDRFSLKPTADLFNVFNSSAITSETTTYGPGLGTPSNIVMGRMLRLGAHVTF
ncbi:MAG: TonB-dependent receptor [Terriglobales bacterium]